MKVKTKPIAVQARMDSYHYRLLHDLAAKLDLSLTQVIRKAIRDLAAREKIE